MMDDEELSRCFASCAFVPVTTDVSPTSKIITSDNLGYHTTSYFLDSSGRSKFVLPLQLGCRNKEDLDTIVASGCLRPAPSDGAANEEGDTDKDKQGDKDVGTKQSLATSIIRFEVKSLSQQETKVVTVEGTRITSCSVEGCSILLETEIVVRSSIPPHASNSTPAIELALDEIEMGGDEDTNQVRAKVEVTAVLVSAKRPSAAATKRKNRGPPDFLNGLAVGGGVASQNLRRTRQIRLRPLHVFLSITEALSVSIQSVPGSSSGSTLVSLTMAHSNTHTEPVIVTNIALHPGHSRHEPYFSGDRSMPGGHESITDMSKYVKWGYAPHTEPKLPFVLKQHEAFATVLSIEAGEDLRSRLFYSPVSVTAMIGREDHEEGADDTTNTGVVVVVSADAAWETGRIAVEPANAFRIDMSLDDSSCYVGAPLVVTLKVLNLGTETRDLMLLIAKDDESRSHSTHKGTGIQSPRSSISGSNAAALQLQSPKANTVNAAVVAESGGYVFGVWGLSGDDDGTTRHNRDHELLAVDAALLIGEVKGQHSVDAELRFVPLREGTLDVPNLKLYDKIEGKWYNCNHMLKIVAANKGE